MSTHRIAVEKPQDSPLFVASGRGQHFYLYYHLLLAVRRSPSEALEFVRLGCVKAHSGTHMDKQTGRKAQANSPLSASKLINKNIGGHSSVYI